MPLAIAFGLFTAGVWPVIAYRERRRGARLIDADGVTRRDGKRFPWGDLSMVRREYARSPSGGLKHVTVTFLHGEVRIYPMTLENARETLDAIDRQIARRFQEICSICSKLRDFERGFQKGGREEEDTWLPAEAASLVDVHEVRPGANRSPVLRQCPECDTHYLYETGYEFLASGSEDEQRLTRLTDREAGKL